MELFIGGAVVLIYLGLVTACILAGIAWAWRKKIGAWGKVAWVVGMFFVAYAIPFGDHTIGYIHFTRLCDTEAGTRIYRTVSGVEGLLTPNADGQLAQTLGFRFVEQGNISATVARFEIRDDKIVEIKNTQSISRYVLAHSRSKEMLWSITGQYVITDLNDGKPIAVHTTISYRGGWLVRAVLAGYGGTAAHCPKEVFSVVKFIISVLKPTTEEK